MAVKQWKLDTWLKRSILERDVEDARKSLAAGADPNHAMVEGEIRSLPLIQAATKHADLLEVLLQYGADMRGTDWQGSTALHFAKISTSSLSCWRRVPTRTPRQTMAAHHCMLPPA